MIQRDIIYDVGAHKGEDTEFYLKKGFTVVAIEASPELCNDLRYKFQEYVKTEQLRIVNVAIARCSGTIDFYIDAAHSPWGTVNSNWVERNKHLLNDKSLDRIRKITVDSASLADIVKEYGVPYYCKIDIEGNDFLALESLRDDNIVPRFVSIESEKLSWQRLVNEFVILRDLGYSRFKIIDQQMIQWQQCPSPAREGVHCDHVFEEGCSGLFGEELPGRWLELVEAIEAYKSIFRGYALNGDSGLMAPKGALDLFCRAYARMFLRRRHRNYQSPAYTLPAAGWYDTHATL